MAAQDAGPRRLESGRPWPLGVHFDGGGVNVAVFSAHAEAVELCLFEGGGARETARLPLPECTDEIWHGYLPGARPGLVYGLRAHGPHDPARGHRFNPHKLLLDPYARALHGAFRWSDAHYGCRSAQSRGEVVLDRRDNAFAMPKARVVDGGFAWDDDRAPRTPWSDTVIWEAHVKGFSMLNPALPPALRGTYAGLAHPASIAHLRTLGVTAVEVLPVQTFVDERMLADQGRVNYWGYNPLAYFVPSARYAGAGDALTEFRCMVRALHAAGIEVIVDVVYNHTAEGDEHGPTLSWRGLDNASYYRLQADDPGRYADLSGCGNTLDLAHPRVLQMVLDSLRYWVAELHVDGFRFDLATALARGPGGFEPRAAFLAALAQDPLLAGVKLIAEPWDIVTWATGRFPAGHAEWNDRYRDAVRDFWLTGQAGCGELARRLTGSADLFRHHGRRPQASINFVTAHDGFTLSDVVSYTHKHNAANGQDNADGSADNRSTNCGVEGPTDDPAVVARRERLARAMLATLFVSQGVPMLPAGDEFGRSQGGNNNAYCQDNATSWLDWRGADAARRRFVAELLALRRAQPALRRTHWFDDVVTPCGEPDIRWCAAHGGAMSPADWEDAGNRAFGFLVGRRAARERAVLVLLNADTLPRPFRLPPPPVGRWLLALDSSGQWPPLVPAGEAVDLPGEAVLVLLAQATDAADGGHG